MSNAETFRDRTFTVADGDARLRDPNDLLSYARYAVGDPLPPGSAVGDIKRIPKGAAVSVSQVRIISTGSRSATVFARAVTPTGADLGWTSTRNFQGRFVNVTLGVLPPAPGAGQYGPNAAWSGGTYLGQIDLVQIVDTALEIERIALKTVDPYFLMVDAAAQAGIAITLNSGFRSYGEQKYLWDGFQKHLPGFNKAAKPGFSHHQNGIAFDIPVAGKSGHPVYDWLTQHATAFDFVRTVSGEPWHWEHDPAKAAAAHQKATFKTPNVSD